MAKSVGYALVSTSYQATDTQVSALKDAWCSNVYNDVISSRTPVEHRHHLQACLAVLEPEDELVVTKLDRLDRTQVEVINRLHDLQVQGVHIRTLDGLISTKAVGKMATLVIGLLTGLAEVERELTRERSRESVEHRKRTGGNLGGRPSLPKVKKDHILRLRQEGNSIRSIAKTTGVSASAVHEFCKEAKIRRASCLYYQINFSINIEYINGTSNSLFGSSEAENRKLDLIAAKYQGVGSTNARLSSGH